MEPNLDLGHLAEEFAKLLVDDPAAIDADDSIALESGERRDVVILFVDIVGFTTLAETLDPEQLKFVMANTLQVLTNQIKRYGGAVEKYIGDAIMAVFGRTHAAEDDDRRAVMAGWGMLEKIQDVNAILAQKGLSMSARIGINRGMIVTGELDGYDTVTGEAVNIAQRLEANAAPNTILLADAVYQRCRDYVQCEALPPLLVKNKTAPLTAHRVTHLRTEHSANRARDDVPLLGRSVECACVATVLTLAQAQLVVLPVCGAAGAGKTRLLRETLAAAQPVWISADAFGMAPYQSIGDVLRAWQREAGVSLTAWAAMHPAVQEYLPYLCDLAGEGLPDDAQRMLQQMTPTARHTETLVALKRWIIAAAHGTSRPLVIVCDNWQWMPDASRELLLQLLGRLPADTPLLCCAVSRDALALTGNHVQSILSVDPLDASSVEMWMQHRLPAQHMTPMMVRQVCERTGGNPLYIRELLYHSSSLAADDRLPSTIAALVLSRFDQLPREHKIAVQMAAVAGRASSLDLLQHLFVKTQIADDAARVCRALCDGGWLRMVGDRLRVAQPMVAEVAYSTMLQANRRKLHAAVAAWCRDTGWDHDASWDAFFAEQWRRADTPELALPHYLRAADYARAQCAYRDAAQLCAAARECADAVADVATRDDALRVIAVQCAGLYEMLGDPVAWRQAIADALSRVAPESADAARLTVGQWEWEYRFGARDVAIARWREFVALTADTPVTPARVTALMHLCNAAFEQGQSADTDVAVLLAIRPQIHEPPLQVAVDRVVFNFYKNTDQLECAAQFFDDVLAAAAHDAYSQHVNDLFFCSFMWDRGCAFGDIARRGAAALHYFDEAGWLRGVAWGAFYQAAALWRMGALSAAQQVVQRVLPRIDAAGDSYMAIRLQLVRAGIAISQADWPAYQSAQAALQQITSGAPDDQCAVHSALALMMAQYATDAARRSWAQAVLQQHGGRGLAPVEHDEYRIALALLAVDQQAWDTAEVAATQMLPRLRAAGKQWLLGVALRIAGQCAAQRGAIEAMAQMFAESVVVLQQIDAHADLALTYRRWWDALLATRQLDTPMATNVRQHLDALDAAQGVEL